MIDRVVAGLAYVSLAGIAVGDAALLQGEAGTAWGIGIVPTFNLVAIVGAAVTVGAMFQRVRDLDRRVRDLERNTMKRSGDHEAQ